MSVPLSAPDFSDISFDFEAIKQSKFRITEPVGFPFGGQQGKYSDITYSEHYQDLEPLDARNIAAGVFEELEKRPGIQPRDICALCHEVMNKASKDHNDYETIPGKTLLLNVGEVLQRLAQRQMADTIMSEGHATLNVQALFDEYASIMKSVAGMEPEKMKNKLTRLENDPPAKSARGGGVASSWLGRVRNAMPFDEHDRGVG